MHYQGKQRMLSDDILHVNKEHGVELQKTVNFWPQHIYTFDYIKGSESGA
jgi:hypothetical protein